MDRFNNFFYVDSGMKPMARLGKFSHADGTLSDLRDFKALPNREVKILAQNVHGNMGVEVSADGSLVFFSRATWDMNGLTIGKILASDILFVTRFGNHYVFDESEARRIMK